MLLPLTEEALGRQPLPLHLLHLVVFLLLLRRCSLRVAHGQSLLGLSLFTLLQLVEAAVVDRGAPVHLEQQQVVEVEAVLAAEPLQLLMLRFLVQQKQ